jgi:transposase
MTVPLAPAEQRIEPLQSKPAPPVAAVALPVTIPYTEYVDLQWGVNYWRRLHERAVERERWVAMRHRHELAKAAAREVALVAEVEHLKGQVRDLRRRVFGARTEQLRFVNPVARPAGERRRRGQQPGRPGHGRRLLRQLAEQIETVDLKAPSCPACGLPLTPMAGVESHEVLEVEVRAYRRTIRRPRYRPGCRCGCVPGIVTAPPAPELIPRGKLGISVWVQVLLGKYLYGQPTYRLLRDWREQGMHVAQGTITDGLQRIAPLFEPLAPAGLSRLREHDHWHADETRWEVWAEVEGKTTHRWYLWVFQASDVVHFTLDPTRSSSVPCSVLAGVDSGILSVDRLAAYGKYARGTQSSGDDGGVELAFCWAHVRRDFLKVANDHPALWRWGMDWAERIGQLYRLHGQRRQVFQAMGCGTAGAAAQYAVLDAAVREAMGQMQQLCNEQLSDPDLAVAPGHALNSLVRYWHGLSIFLDHPWLDLDNNAAERALRPAVVARKNFYGSGSTWSAALAANMLSVLMTARIWQLPVRRWLHEYLQACADAGGRAPDDLAPFVPWRMSEQRLAALRRPGAVPATADTS